MPRDPMFVVLDDTNHVLVGDEHTACGLLVPHGTDWATARPSKVCAECAEKALGETPTGKPKGDPTIYPEPVQHETAPNPNAADAPLSAPVQASKAKAK